MMHQVTVAREADPEAVRLAIVALGIGQVTVPHPRTPRLIHVDADEFAHDDIESVSGVEFCCSADEPVRLFLAKPLTPDQWALGAISNTGLEFISGWSGYGQRVYTLDTAANTTLAEFDGAVEIIHNPQGVGAGFHGTVTAACVVGGVYGVAESAALYNAVGFDPDGTDATTQRLNAALSAIADHVEDNPNMTGRDILSMSFGTTGLLIGNPFAAALDRLRDLNVILIAAAGNGDGTTGYNMSGLTNVWPAEDPDVISVGAHDVTGARGGFSNYPANIYAPGVACENIDHTGAVVTGLNGTSLSAPYFAGAVACVAEAGYSDPAGFLMAAAQDVVAVPGGSGLRLWLDPNLPYSSEADPTPPAFAADLDVDGGAAATAEYLFEADGGGANTIYHPNHVINEVA